VLSQAGLGSHDLLPRALNRLDVVHAITRWSAAIGIEDERCDESWGRGCSWRGRVSAAGDEELTIQVEVGAHRLLACRARRAPRIDGRGLAYELLREVQRGTAGRPRQHCEISYTECAVPDVSAGNCDRQALNKGSDRHTGASAAAGVR
jgi:hypothetical protein